MMCLFDANIFLRTLVKENQHTFEECTLALSKLKNNQLQGVTTHLTIAEIAWTLGSFYGFTRHEIALAITSIGHVRGLSIIDEYDLPAAIALYEQRKIKFIDAMIASIPDVVSKRWIVVSYDRDFDKLGIIRKEPGDI